MKRPPVAGITNDMKAVELLHCQAGSVLSRQDGSVKLSYVTPELRPSEAGALLLLHGKNVRLTIIPEDVEVEETISVETERDTKTPSQRLRAILFVTFKEQERSGSFQAFYEVEMDKIINHYKKKLPE